MTLLLPFRRPLLGASWCRNVLWRNAKATPSLDLDFATRKSLADGVTGRSFVDFTRASSGTYVGSDGLIKTATTDEARFDHDPTTGESLGLLVEESRTNLLLRSEEFDNASWVKTNVTVTTNATIAPDGRSTADLHSVDASGAYQGQSVSGLTAGATVSFSIYLKKGSADFALLRVARTGATTYGEFGLYFNLFTGVVSTSANLGSGILSASAMQSLPNGWYRCTIVGSVPSATGYIAYLYSTSSNSVLSAAGNSLYAWGAQLEAGAFPTSYIPTVASTVTRSADVASITGTNFSSWYRQDQMTLFASYALLETTGNAAINRHVFQTDTGAASGRMFYLASYTGTAAGRARYFDESTTSLFPANTGRRFAVALATNDNAMSVNGSTPTIDLTGSPISGQTRAGIGQPAAATGSQPLNGTISRLTYWPQRLPDSTLQQITQ